MEIAEQRIELIEKERILAQTYRWGIGIVLLLTIIIIVLIYKRLRHQKKTNQQLNHSLSQLQKTLEQFQGKQYSDSGTASPFAKKETLEEFGLINNSPCFDSFKKERN